MANHKQARQTTLFRLLIPSALVLMGALVALPTLVAAQENQAEIDSLDQFLEDLSKTTDEYFGPASVDFDTTGIDTMFLNRLKNPLVLPGYGGTYFSPTLVMRFNRSEGYVLGLGGTVWTDPIGSVYGNGAYGFSNKEFRYKFGWRRILWHRDRLGFVSRRDLSRNRNARSVSMLRLEVEYDRQTAYFTPEHSQPAISNLNAFFLGTDRQSNYERRGIKASVRFRIPDWDMTLGYRNAKDQPMPKTTSFTLFGSDSSVPGVTLADPIEYDELFGRVRFARQDWGFAGLVEGKGLGDATWRLRSAVAKDFRLGRPIRGFVQVEGGAAEANAPIQRRFQQGGPVAIPTLGFGVGDTDHVLLGRLELVEGHNLLRLLKVPHPDFMDFNGGVFFHYGAVWDDPAQRDILFSKPPGDAWRGAAGMMLVYRPGLPNPRTLWRIQMGWPVGPEGGVARLTLSVGSEFDLVLD